LPDLGLPLIKAKVDTGARTSCLHAFELDTFSRDGRPWVRFLVHPHQHSQEVAACESPLLENRLVTDSGGHSEERPVISTRLALGDWEDQVEITLTSRDNMLFRMLLGRTTIKKGGFSVDPAHSYLQNTREDERKPDL
jgi:hypothetical protein